MTEVQILGSIFVGVLFICFVVCLAFVLVRRRKRMAEVIFPDDLFLPTGKKEKTSYLFEIHSHHSDIVHKNLSKSPYPKEPQFLFSPPLGGLSFQASDYHFRKGAPPNLTFQSNHVRPLEPLHSFPAYRPAERRTQMTEDFRRPPLPPPVARHSPKRFSFAYALRKATAARPHPFSEAALREPSYSISG